VAEQAMLDVFERERLLEQRIVAQIDHPGGEVIARAPIGVDMLDFVSRQRSGLRIHDRGRSGVGKWSAEG